MTGLLDLLIVAAVTVVAAVFAFLSLAPRPWRAPLLHALAAAAASVSLRAFARRLNEAAARSATAGGCGGCGDCGSGKPGGAPDKPADVGVPLSSIKRRR